MKYATFFLAIISLLIFNCTNISPNQSLWAGIVTFLIPFALLSNGLLFVYLAYKNRYLSVVPLMVVLAGFKFLLGTFAINFPKNKGEDPVFSVLSYNTAFFRKTEFKRENKIERDGNAQESDSYNMLQWIVANQADIKCFQEFYHYEEEDLFNTVEIISENGKYDYYISAEEVPWNTSRTGIAIFSKHPIVNSGEINFEEGGINRAAFADIKIKHDTIRIINTHLQSMNLKPNNPLDAKSLSNKKEDLKTIYHKFNRGQIDRSYQAEILMEKILDSPYKVILVGDFNQTPYSFVYHSFKERLHNAFEHAGNGFGFTYNGNTLFFLRIDNQFFDPELKILDFITYNDIPYSDHYPIEASYSIPQ